MRGCKYRLAGFGGFLANAAIQVGTLLGLPNATGAVSQNPCDVAGFARGLPVF